MITHCIPGHYPVSCPWCNLWGSLFYSFYAIDPSCLRRQPRVRLLFANIASRWLLKWLLSQQMEEIARHGKRFYRARKRRLSASSRDAQLAGALDLSLGPRLCQFHMVHICKRRLHTFVFETLQIGALVSLIPCHGCLGVDPRPLKLMYIPIQFGDKPSCILGAHSRVFPK